MKTSVVCVLFVLLASVSRVTGQPLHMSPSFHRISYTVGPNGQSNMGGHGDELEPFFRGLGSNGRRPRGGRTGGRWNRPPFWRSVYMIG